MFALCLTNLRHRRQLRPFVALVAHVPVVAALERVLRGLVAVLHVRVAPVVLLHGAVERGVAEVTGAA